MLKAIDRNDASIISPFCNYLISQAKRTPNGLLFLDNVQPSKHAGLLNTICNHI